jgi:hypothetical protein
MEKNVFHARRILPHASPEAAVDLGIAVIPCENLAQMMRMYPTGRYT